nr:immunoglobulin heavy chain junction region [Macaca mulatta]MOW75226.1 immunoglobulin heavy chain junction region [Macaca mulatta]MOW75269.1 immunoglobulin heavy chain junction region [Macaca mulatta]MOW75473.1 immunoglobulin heavy chain junction region [Macaca mulatta]MOW75793.1 immunoglobulin heavy chain junction region [Macaca mulatta]
CANGAWGDVDYW